MGTASEDRRATRFSVAFDAMQLRVFDGLSLAPERRIVGPTGAISLSLSLINHIKDSP